MACEPRVPLDPPYNNHGIPTMLASDGAQATKSLSETEATSFNLRWIWTISLVAALGGLLFGYDWVVIGGAKPFYEKYFHLVTAEQVGWAMSSALIGCLGGAILSGRLPTGSGGSDC